VTLTGANKRQETAYPKDPLEWYVEPRWCVEQIADAIDFGNDLIWDCSCGRGTILDVFADRGHQVIGSDVVDRKPRHRAFYRGNFLNVTKTPTPTRGGLSIVNNPPFSRAAEFMHKAVNLTEVRRAAFIVPLEFLCSKGRHRLFTTTTPSHVAFCSQRPSMPPGAMVEDMGAKAFTGGKSDFVWIVFTAPHRWRTQAIWLRPTDH